MTKPILFFAESCPYGTHTLSDRDMLVRFETANARDAWVSEDHEKRGALGPADARRIWALGSVEAADVFCDGEIIPAIYAPEAPARYKIG